MIYLKYPRETNQIKNWRERLDNLIVGYKAQEVPVLKEPVLSEGEDEYVGVTSIDQFLKELEAEVEDWRTHRCGV